MVAGQFRLFTGNDLFNDRPHGEVGSAWVKAVTEKRGGLLEDGLIDDLGILQRHLLALGLVEFLGQPEAIQMCEVSYRKRPVFLLLQ